MRVYDLLFNFSCGYDTTSLEAPCRIRPDRSIGSHEDLHDVEDLFLSTAMLVHLPDVLAKLALAFIRQSPCRCHVPPAGVEPANLLVRSQALCPLSYRGVKLGVWRGSNGGPPRDRAEPKGGIEPLRTGFADQQQQPAT